jgi:hypothetical protein
MADALNFDLVVSLGQACDTSFQIRRRFGQSHSHPFDWLITPFSGLTSLIESGFEGFLRPGSVTQEHHYVLDKPTGAMFLHDFPDLAQFELHLDEVRSKYQRRIDRWNTAMHLGGRILFVRSQQYSDNNVIYRENAKYLLQLLNAKYPKVDSHLLVVNPAQAGIEEVREANLSLLRITPPDPFVWSGSDAAWDRCFAAISAG